MALKLSASLPGLVRTQYQSATACNAVTLATTELAIIRVSGIAFQLRYCPALAKKPTPQRDHVSVEPPKKKFDPFENPSKELLIAEVPGDDPSHILVLNKYPIIPNHFILATKSNKPQSHKLEQDDIALTYECLRSWDENAGKTGRLLAFFNSGEHSGASQAHRHVQFVPEEDMRVGNATNTWSLLADQLPSNEEDSSTSLDNSSTQKKLPFLSFASRISSASIDPIELYDIYCKLYLAAFGAVEEYVHTFPQNMQLHRIDTGDLPISYNLAMTTSAMVLCPRRSEGMMIKRHDGSDLDFVSLNGTMLGGTLMVKNEELWHILREDERKLKDILEAVGVPRTTSTRSESL